MYRDVYEHRGTLHHFIYCAGLLISHHNLTGVYVIEVMLFSIFLFFCAKTVSIITKNNYICLLCVLLTGFLSSSFRSFGGGGESEEFALPFLMIPVFFITRHFIKYPEKNFLFYEMMITGICFSMIFWMKYTITGLFLGLLISVIISGVHTKQFKNIFIYILQFTIGALIGSLPVLIYHAVTHSLYDMVYVYFYTLIFKYSNSSVLISIPITRKILLTSKYIIPASLCIIFASKKQFSPTLKLFSLIMLIGETLGISCGYSWPFAREPLFVFLPLCYSCLWSIIDTKLLTNDELSGKLKSIIDSFKSDFEKAPKKTLAALNIITIVAFGISTPFVSAVFGYRKFKLSDYPQYKISQYILQHSETDSPIIVNYDCLDTGVYWLTNLYPPSKYYCSYNLNSDEITSVYDEYLTTKKADYIITTAFFNVPKADVFDGYTTVAFEALPDNMLNNGGTRYQLMKRDDYGK